MGLFKSIGSMFNDLTGATSAANLNNKFQKEFAQNAHQWETEDLKKAGLNPILSAGGSGAAASGGGTAGTGSAGITDVANSANAIMQTVSNVDLQEKQAENAQADTELKKAETAGVMKKNGWIDPKAEKDIEETTSRILSNKSNSARQVVETRKSRGDPRTMLGSIFENAEKRTKNGTNNSAKKNSNSEWKNGFMNLFKYRSTK